MSVSYIMNNGIVSGVFIYIYRTKLYGYDRNDDVIMLNKRIY